MRHKADEKGNGKVSLLLVCLLVLILILIVLIVMFNRPSSITDQSGNSIYEESQQLGELSDDSAKALFIKDKIEEKLDLMPDYDYEMSIQEFKDIYSTASDSLKVYLAVEFASFLSQHKLNLDIAEDIIDDAESRVDGLLFVSFYPYFIEYYKVNGNEQKANAYQNKYNEMELYYLERTKEDE